MVGFPVRQSKAENRPTGSLTSCSLNQFSFLPTHWTHMEHARRIGECSPVTLGSASSLAQCPPKLLGIHFRRRLLERLRIVAQVMPIWSWSLYISTLLDQKSSQRSETRCDRCVRTARCRSNQSKRDADAKARRLDDLRSQRLYGATCIGRGITTGSEPCAGRPACRPNREVGGRTQSARAGL